MLNKTLWEKCVEFHGHECPGLAIGFRASQIAMEKMGLKFSEDEEVVCITENDACSVDAVQVVTGCTLGKGNLIYRGTGKMAFSFFNRKNGKSIRVVLRKFQGEMSREDRLKYILEASEQQVFYIKKPHYSIPIKARKFNTILCEKCGEGAPEHKIRISNGLKLCMDCFEEYSRGW
ncbi:formylmethanofuran dehydrogenase subunit E [Clostridium tetanomorphum]|nr:formylmethanofuran dehydrogenase subunit E [Clostridium tetanomorphum]NRS86112.1 formylmethanofuran dehydrogenase subunit E [Clostridium tetanomorphum]NRZ95867.1 formylmethanofuran dehydrogenase subunit E [Clostridium tetanomorphum]SQB89664.1 formylmethanofuran dehydrogenase subunit E [Clostridium tetanomorphum]